MLPWVVFKIQWPDYWNVDHIAKVVLLLGDTLQERDHNVAETLHHEREKGTFAILQGWRNELYPVYNEQKEIVVNIERAGSALFGIMIYGVHMTGYVKSEDPSISIKNGLQIWVARRSLSKQTYPGMLDNTIGGGVPSGDEPLTSLLREAAEEASIPTAYVRQNAKVCGTITYFDIRDDRAGGESGLLQPECIYVYDLQMEKDIILNPGDHEAENFALWNIEQITQALKAGEFKTNCALVLLDFMIRHSLLSPEEEKDYIEILARLHRKLEFPTR
ncbi:hypothetical protein MMC18_007331 [Xylographa bjoerkii]|nr:hypothetical protein [Xylographa bjoerkii]